MSFFCSAAESGTQCYESTSTLGIILYDGWKRYRNKSWSFGLAGWIWCYKHQVAGLKLVLVIHGAVDIKM
jgi:hypothetical protein